MSECRLHMESGSTRIETHETSLMAPDFAELRAWSAATRDRFPEGHPVRNKSYYLCKDMDAYCDTLARIIRWPDSPKTFQTQLKGYEDQIETLREELICLGLTPPPAPAWHR
jgi:hypothetical protein